MFLRFLLTFLLMTSSVFNVFVLSNADETCSISAENSGSSSGSDSSCSKATKKEDNRFRLSWNKYLTEYEKAQQNYEKTKCHTEKPSKLYCDYERIIQHELGKYNEIT